MRRAAALLAALCLPGLAATPWIDTPSSRVFRQRVVDLALLYGESSGLDENGFLVRAAVRAGEPGPCKTVDISITLRGQLSANDTTRACPKP